MNQKALNAWTSTVLRIGTYLGVMAMMVGLIADALGYGDTVLYVGILILVATPMAGVFASALCFAKDRDWKWLGASSLLVLVIVVGLIASWFF